MRGFWWCLAHLSRVVIWEEVPATNHKYKGAPRIYSIPKIDKEEDKEKRKRKDRRKGFMTLSFDDRDILAARLLCVKASQLKKLLPTVIADGGEGLILRKLSSPYLRGRSNSLVKLKVYISFFFIIFLKCMAMFCCEGTRMALLDIFQTWNDALTKKHSHIIYIFLIYLVFV